MSFLNILLFGAPGSGKGTQSKMLASEYNLFHLSTGDLLREAKNDPLSSFFKEINEKMSKGELVSDDIIYNIVAEKITFIKKVRFFCVNFLCFPFKKKFRFYRDKYDYYTLKNSLFSSAHNSLTKQIVKQTGD